MRTDPDAAVALTSQRLDRARLYVVVDAIEADLRRLLAKWVLPFLGESETFAHLFDDKIEMRLRSGPDSLDQELLDFLYLGESIALLNLHGRLLPDDTWRAVRASTPRIESMVAVRNRVMHGRPLLETDAETLFDGATALLETGLELESLRATLEHLENDPAWAPLFELRLAPVERVLHSLPIPDFDETGLVGRASEASQLLRLLLRGRDRVITVIGEGGVGKTALVVKTLFDLIDDEACPYEAVLWASLKTELLQTEGTRVLVEAARELRGIAAQLGSALDEGESDLDQLADALAGVTTLIVVDNIETVDASEILELHDAMPDGVRFLFTSRVGLGQLERRVQVAPLDSRQATQLFRQMASSRRLEQLTRVPDEALRPILSKLRGNPLAIKWYVIAVGAGASPEDLRAGETDLLAYSLKNVYDRLEPPASRILGVMYAVDRPVSYPELVVLAEQPLDEVRWAIQQLQASALLDVAAKGQGDATPVYRISASAAGFLSRIVKVDFALVREVRDADQRLRDAEAFRRKDEARRSLGPANVYTRTDADVPVSTLLRQALQHSYLRNLPAAREAVGRARSLAPDYFEVERVAGSIESSHGHVVLATEHFERALRGAEPRYQPVVAYYYAGHLAQRVGDPAAAVAHAELAHSALSDPVATMQLGRIYAYLGRFDESRALLEEVLRGTVGKMHLIARTMLVDLAKRETEHLLEIKLKPVAAAEAAGQGVSTGSAALTSGVRDMKLSRAVLGCAAEGAQAIVKAPDLAKVVGPLEVLLAATELWAVDWVRERDWPYLATRLARLAGRSDAPSHIRDQLAHLFARPDLAMYARHRGTIAAFMASRGFGFIARDGHPDLYFHVSKLLDPTTQAALVEGLSVVFAIGSGPLGPHAFDIEVQARPPIAPSPR